MLHSKIIIKAAALVILGLELYWVVCMHKEPHAVGVASAVASLFGGNACHEYFNTDKKDGGV